jgi:transposase InsO family protein
MEEQDGDESIRDRLVRIYYDTKSAGAYGGVGRLVREAARQGLKVSNSKATEILADELAYSLHKPARRRYKRNKTYVSGPDKQWQADLADMQEIAAQNGGMKYLLTCIDVFSKYAWVVPIKNKGAQSMVEAFGTLFEQAGGRKPTRLQTDKGTEFMCKPVQTLLKARGIHHFVSNSDMKAAVVERFNRTIKTRIFTYFTAKKTKRYVDVLQDFVTAYNTSKHCSIGMTPASVRAKHTNEIWRRLYGDGSARPPDRKSAQPGELVRISRWKGTFEKGYKPNWSKETFHVNKVIRQPHTMFELHDKEGEPLRGNFYAKEIQKVKSGEYVVEKILKERRKPDGTLEVFVKWEGWPASYNSWVAKDSLNDHQ